MGDDFQGSIPVNQTSFNYTATRSRYELKIHDAVEMAVEFLSPVFPDDFKRQSIAGSYIAVSVKSSDGQEHNVGIYVDVLGGKF